MANDIKVKIDVDGHADNVRLRPTFTDDYHPKDLTEVLTGHRRSIEKIYDSFTEEVARTAKDFAETRQALVNLINSTERIEKVLERDREMQVRQDERLTAIEKILFRSGQEAVSGFGARFRDDGAA